VETWGVDLKGGLRKGGSKEKRAARERAKLSSTRTKKIGSHDKKVQKTGVHGNMGGGKASGHQKVRNAYKNFLRKKPTTKRGSSQRKTGMLDHLRQREIRE